MGFDYALVYVVHTLVYAFYQVPRSSWLTRHLKYTIPPSLALTILYRPLLTRLDVCKVILLITVSCLLCRFTTWLNILDSRCLYYTLGFLPDQDQHMDLSKPRNPWSGPVSYPCRRAFFLCRSNLRDVFLVSLFEQTHFPPSVSALLEAWRGIDRFHSNTRSIDLVFGPNSHIVRLVPGNLLG